MVTYFVFTAMLSKSSFWQYLIICIVQGFVYSCRFNFSTQNRFLRSIFILIPINNHYLQRNQKKWALYPYYLLRNKYYKWQQKSIQYSMRNIDNTNKKNWTVKNCKYFNMFDIHTCILKICKKFFIQNDWSIDNHYQILMAEIPI